MTYLDRNGREPQLVSGDDYEQVGYDEDGTPILHKKEERTKEEKLKDVEMLDQTYDTLNDGLSIMNEAGNVVMPKWIEGQTRPNNIGKGTWNKKIAGELAEQSKFYSKASKVLDVASYAGVVVDVGVGVYDNRKAGTSWKKTLSDAEVDLHLSLFNLGASTAAGAAIGTVTCPVVGTLVGIAIGLFIDVVFCKIKFNGKTMSEWLKESNWKSKNIPNLLEEAQKL